MDIPLSSCVIYSPRKAVMCNVKEESKPLKSITHMVSSEVAGYVNGVGIGNVNSIVTINYEFISMMETLDGSGATDAIFSPKASNDTIVESEFQSTPCTHHDLISELFFVSLKTHKDFEDFTMNIELGKFEVWLELSDEKRQEVIDTFGAMLEALKAENLDDRIPSKVTPSDPIVQSVDINTKSTSYAGAASASVKDQPKVTSNFRPLVANPVFDGVNISIPRKVVEKSMDTSLIKEKLIIIPIWVKLHDVPLQVFEEDGISLISTFIGKPVMLNSYTSFMCNDSWGRSSFARCLIEVDSEADLVDVVTIGIPSLTMDGFTKETIHVVSPPIISTSNVVTLTVEKTNDGFQTVGKRKKKGKSKSTNSGQFGGPSVKQNVRYEPKATTSIPKKGATNVGNISKSPSVTEITITSTKKGNIATSNP
uniref:Zinc knuckle CX2CX4HX4C n=1 Tax=Tanacetum cinerariifolium TaxID=118510 RepID=A0A6L2JA29_TANCI|nr:zinc knuckle CX2CX4HX4C [Tanacetum cinerariifolium]